MAILESVKELASKLGAETNGRTIADQINIINQHLEAETANDIAGAVKEYSKKAGSGGGGGETFEVEFSADPETGEIIANKTYAQALTAIQNNNIINFTFGVPYPYITGGCFIYSNPVTKKDDMYFIFIPIVQAFYDEEGIISAMELILWTETGITTRQYTYTPY